MDRGPLVARLTCVPVERSTSIYSAEANARQIMEARGNGPSYPAQGFNFVRSTLTWGPLPAVTARLFGWQSLKRSSYAQNFHTYTLEWTENFIKIYVDSRLKNMVLLQVDKKQQTNGGFFWKRGNFPFTANNNSATEIVVPNPWTTATVQNATNAAPFDQREFQTSML
jgi:hypothetical protein